MPPSPTPPPDEAPCAGCAALMRFGAMVLEGFREGYHGDLDGSDVQGWAEQAGVLEPRTVEVPCDADGCECSPGDICFFIPEAVKAALAEARRGG